MKNRSIASGVHRDAAVLPPKPIPMSRDRIQRELITGALGMLLTAKTVFEVANLIRHAPLPLWFWVSCAASIGFAVLVLALKSTTGPGATLGGLICLQVLMRQELGVSWLHTAMPALIALFVLTFAATRFGRLRKHALGVAEDRRGRHASQVLANLGIAGLLAAGGTPGSRVSVLMLAGCVAALAEAAADTVASELGQALALTVLGHTRSVITGRPITPGSDGGISIAGTALGSIAAAVIVLLSPFAHASGPALCIFAAACLGMFFDSVLGATVEQRGWFGNDLVNLSSTLFAALFACAAILLI